MIEFIGDGGHAKVLIDVLSKSWPWEKSGHIIAVGDNRNRKKEADALYEGGFAIGISPVFAILRHPSAIIASDVQIGEGTVIMAGVIIQPSCKIGKHVILNTSCTVDHDCIIEDFAHIAPGVHLCGGVHVGEGALMGVGSCAVPGAKIEPWSLVKANTVAK